MCLCRKASCFGLEHQREPVPASALARPPFVCNRRGTRKRCAEHRPTCRQWRLRFVDSPFAFAITTRISRPGTDQAAHPLDGAALSRQKARLPFEQRDEEVLHDIFGFVFEAAAERCPGFGQEPGAEPEGNRTDGFAIACGGPPADFVELGGDLRVVVCGLNGDCGDGRMNDCGFHGTLPFFGVNRVVIGFVSRGRSPPVLPRTCGRAGRPERYCQGVRYWAVALTARLPMSALRTRVRRD